MHILIEDNWIEDIESIESDDIIKFINKNNYTYSIKTYDELLDIDSNSFFDTLCLCNTEIIQYHLEKLNKLNCVPDTYEPIYKYYFYRNIEKMSFRDFTKKYLGTKKFIKPCKNNKLFDGKVVKDLTDFTDFCIDIPEDNTEIYVTDPIKILCEVRLLIGNNKLYGYGYISTKKDNSYLKSDLINDLIKITNNKFRCIDIGLSIINNKKKWIVIEINPPFSLNNYDIDIKSYIDFCIDSFEDIKKVNL